MCPADPPAGSLAKTLKSSVAIRFCLPGRRACGPRRSGAAHRPMQTRPDRCLPVDMARMTACAMRPGNVLVGRYRKATWPLPIAPRRAGGRIGTHAGKRARILCVPAARRHPCSMGGHCSTVVRSSTGNRALNERAGFRGAPAHRTSSEKRRFGALAGERRWRRGVSGGASGGASGGGSFDDRFS